MSSEDSIDPVCYRHADRVTYVSCSRCGNPICPECMIPAAVGFHCPNCVAAGRASTRTVTEFRPYVTYAIIIACVIVQVLGQLGLGTSSGWVQEYSLFPAGIAVYGEYYRLITAVFVHSGWLHLGMNMMVLWIMGRSLEAAIGRVRMLLLFLMAGFGGAVASYWFNGPLVAGVGASGAIFGLFGAVFMVGRELRMNTQEVLTLIGLNLLIGFIIPGVDWHAHLGGLVTGALVGWTLIPRRPRLVQLLGPLVALAVLVLLVQARTPMVITALAATGVIHS